jgi:hypothetical protein
MSLTDPKLNEQAVLLFAPQIKRTAVLHEFGHCTGAKTKQGTELRAQYKLYEDDLDEAISEVYPRHLAEAIIHLPEDAWIEEQIVKYATEDENNLCTSPHDYLANALTIFSSSLQAIQQNELGDPVRYAIQRFYQCLNCIIFAEISNNLASSANLKTKFIDLAKRFQSDCVALAGVDVYGIWNLRKRSMKAWVHESASILIIIVKVARTH